MFQLDLRKKGESNTWSSVLVIQVGDVLPRNILSIALKVESQKICALNIT